MMLAFLTGVITRSFASRRLASSICVALRSRCFLEPKLRRERRAASIQTTFGDDLFQKVFAGQQLNLGVDLILGDVIFEVRRRSCPVVRSGVIGTSERVFFTRIFMRDSYSFGMRNVKTAVPNGDCQKRHADQELVTKQDAHYVANGDLRLRFSRAVIVHK